MVLMNDLMVGSGFLEVCRMMAGVFCRMVAVVFRRLKPAVPLMCVLSIGLNAQSPYRLNLNKELTLTGVGISTGLTGLYLRSTVQPYRVDALTSLDPGKINDLDRGAVHNYSGKADRASDILLHGSLAAPALLLAGRKIRSEPGTIAVLWVETALVVSGITTLTKFAVRRTRPFVYNPSIPADAKTGIDAKASFFSGHTSFTAANTFFAARVFSDYYPHSKWKPVVWGLAAIFPAATGYLRVKGGKHFPTDVITGYAVGALTGFVVPELHKAHRAGNTLSLVPGWNSIGLIWEIR
jgi:membrane-associated phospholipid phosphatase